MIHKGCENTDGYNCQNVGKKLVFLDTSNIKAFSHFIRHRRCPLPPFEGNLYTLLGKSTLNYFAMHDCKLEVSANTHF